MPSRASWDDTLGTGARQSRSNHRARICRDGLHRCDRICCRSHAHRQSRAAPSLPQPPEPEPQHAMRQARNQSSLAAGVAAATGRFSQRASELRTTSPDATQQRSIHLLVRLTGGSRTEERRGDTAGRSCRGEGGGMSGAPATERWRKAAARLVTAREAMGRSGGAAAACSVLAVTMKVALALSPENAVESKRRRVSLRG